jgi:hypothetical protein
MSWINLSALWKIVVYGLLAGAGLPALFAGGLYSLSLGPNRTRAAGAGASGAGASGDANAESGLLVGGSPVGMAVAALAFLIVLAAVGWSIYEIYTLGHPAKK